MMLAPSLPRTTTTVASPAESVSAAVAVETATVDVTELLALVERLDAHARVSGERVSLRGLVARALLTAGSQHPGVDARWPSLPARHGLRVSELTAAIEQAEAASPLPDDAAVLSVGAIVSQPADVEGRIEMRPMLPLSLAFDPRRSDAVAAGMLLRELVTMLAEPLELVARG
jgi:pyruvate/2-oxoglutarate dehydrogenase complex dihydrolipoamide acyltransferase (E2) component